MVGALVLVVAVSVVVMVNHVYNIMHACSVVHVHSKHDNYVQASRGKIVSRDAYIELLLMVVDV